MDEKDKFKPIRTKNDIKKKSAIFFLRKKEKKKIDFEWELPKIDEVVYILKKPKKERNHKDIKVLSEYLIANFDYFKRLKSKSDPYQYEKTLYVLKYEEVKQGKNIVTYDEDGDKCYIVLEGAIAILKPIYTTRKLTMREYVYYLKEMDKKDPSTITRQRIIEKNNHIEIDVLGLMKQNLFTIDNDDKYNIFLESFEKVFEAKEGFSFGEAALLYKQKRNATVRAEKLCKLIYIDKYDYNKVLKEIEKRRIDDSIKKFVKKFNFFSRWGYINMNKLYSLMTDLQLFKDDFLYKQNEDSEYIYFCIDGTYEIYSLISFGWKKEFIKYISNSSSNIFLKIDPTKRINDIKLIRIINEAKNNAPKSPMISSQFDSGKFNIGLIELNNIEELIITKEEKFSNPYDIFKINMNNLDSSGILGLEEAVEFKKRFTSIKVKSKMATLKRIKALDFFRVLVNNPKDERNDELMLNYICEKKKSLINQILLCFNYKKNIQMNKYIEEYKKCYSGSSFNKPIQKSMISYINTLSTNPIDINKTKNIFSNRKYKVTNPINVNLLYKSSYESSPPKKNISNEIRTKRSPPKNNTLKIRPFSSNNEKLFTLNNKYKYESTYESKKDLKYASFSPYYKSQKSVKFKEEIKNFTNNNETTLSSSNFSNLQNNLTNRTLINYKKNCISLTKKKDDKFDKISKSRNTKKFLVENNLFNSNNTDKVPSFNLRDYKKNLYFKCGFFVNEIIRLGLGPNIPLRKEIMFLKDDSFDNNNIFNIDSGHTNTKAFSIDNDDRKRRNYFLKITKL